MANIPVIQSCDIAANYYRVAVTDRPKLGKLAIELRKYNKILQRRYPGIRNPQNLYVLHWLDTYGELTRKELGTLFSDMVESPRIYIIIGSLIAVDRIETVGTTPQTYRSLITH